MNTPLNIKKIALIVTGLVVVVALGVFLGRGNLFKGSFIGTESDAIPVPTNVKITQDANQKFVLSWDYDKDAEAKSFLTYTNAVDANIPAVAFTWNIQNAATGTSIGVDDVVNDVSPVSGADCNVQLNDGDMRETIDGYICHEVFLNDAIAAELMKGQGVTIKVRAYTGVALQTDPSIPEDPYVRQISKAGLGEYTLPISAAKPVDTVTLTLPDQTTGRPLAMAWNWNDATYQPSTANSLFADHDNHYFGYAWEITDITDRDNQIRIFTKDVFDDPGTLKVFPGQDPVEAEAAKQACLVNPSGFTGKIWTCTQAYVPDIEGFVDGHIYTATVTVYSGAKDAAGALIPSNPTTSDIFTVTAPAPVIVPPEALDNLDVTVPAKEGDLVTFTYGWIDRGIEPSATTTTFKDAEGNYQFVYEAFVQESNTGKIVWHNNFGTPSEQNSVLITGYAPPKPVPAPTVAGYESCIATIDGVQSWVCQKGYVPSDISLTPGKTYSLTVNAYSTPTVNHQGQSSSNSTYQTYETFVMPDFTPKLTPPKSLDYVNVVFPDVKGDPITFDYGWNNPSVKLSAADTSLVDVNGNYRFVYHITVQDEAGNVVWHNQKGASPSLFSLAPSAKECIVYINNARSWICQNAYLPMQLDAGKTYSVRVAVFFADTMSTGYIEKNFTTPAATPVVIPPTDTTAPKVVSATSLTQNKVKIVFSEKINLPSTTPESAFSIKDKDGVAIKVNSATVDPSDTTGMTIILVTDDQKGNPGYIITVAKDVVDLAGNPIDTSSNRAEYATPTTPVVVPVTPVTPVTPVVIIPPTMTLKNLSVKKLTDGNVALTYAIDLAGTWTATEFSSEVRLNDSKVFVAKFHESSLTHMLRPNTAGPTTTYTYEAVLLPWEIKAGDTLKVFMNASGLNTNDYTNDGQSVVYDAGAKILDAVVGLVTANALPNATVGSPYSAAIVVKDGVAPYKYIVGAGSTLPEGLSLNPLTGVLSGTPTKDNAYAFGLSITDAKNAALNATFTLKVVPAPVAGTVVVTPPASGGTTIINNYTTYNPVAPVVPAVPATPPSNRYLFPINLGPSLFQDVAYHWARNYINVLWNAGFVQGYTGRTFGPDDSLTRGQLLKIVMESLHYKIPTKVAYSPCVDVQTNQWYAKYFAVAREKGIIGGYTDGTCRPNKITNRAESLKILYAAIAQMPEVPVMKVTATVPAGFRNTFYDLNENSWYYPYFANAQSLGIINGFADETARPDSELSRAQMSKIVVLMMQKLAWPQ